MSKIVQAPHSVLRTKAKKIEISEISSAAIKDIIQEMKNSLDAEEDGVAIAAPQINVSLRLFIVSKRASKLLSDDTIFINPEIIRLGKNKEQMSEGCLSVRWQYGMVKRSTTATVRALNEKGHEFVMSGRGLLAQIFQHEIDHLNGILFVDKAKDLQDIPPQKK